MERNIGTLKTFTMTMFSKNGGAMRLSSCLYIILMFMFLGTGVLAAETSGTPISKNSYTLTELETSEGSNVITKYVYDEEQGKIVQKYYRLDLKKTEYGEGENSMPFSVTPIDTSVDITYKYVTKTYTNEYTSRIENVSNVQPQ